MTSTSPTSHPPGLFITGTDTEVGKTYVGCCIARQLVSEGVKVGVYKPVASGCIEQNGTWISGDAMELWNAADKPLSLDEVCPQKFIAPLAPHLAAREEGRGVDQELIRSGLKPWLANSEFILVEGAGGLLCPLSDEESYMANLASDFGYPLVIVARNALGTINHTLLTLEVAQRRGLKVAAVVVNHLIETDDQSTQTNVAEIRKRAKAYDVSEIVELGLNAASFQSQANWRSLALS